MDGNLTGVRATSVGFEAFCSRNGEEMHLGFFHDPGIASQVADLGTIKAALEASLPLQGLELNEAIDEKDWPEEVLRELKTRSWQEILDSFVCSDNAGLDDPNPNHEGPEKGASREGASVDRSEQPSTGTSGGNTSSRGASEAEPSSSSMEHETGIKGTRYWKAHGANVLGREVTDDVLCKGRMTIPGNTLGFFGLSHNGGEIALLHRHTGKRWQLAARRLSDKPIVQICSGMKAVAQSLGLQAGQTLWFRRQQPTSAVYSGVPTITVSSSLGFSDSSEDEEAEEISEHPVGTPASRQQGRGQLMQQAAGGRCEAEYGPARAPSAPKCWKEVAPGVFRRLYQQSVHDRLRMPSWVAAALGAPCLPCAVTLAHVQQHFEVTARTGPREGYVAFQNGWNKVVEAIGLESGSTVTLARVEGERVPATIALSFSPPEHGAGNQGRGPAAVAQQGGAGASGAPPAEQAQQGRLQRSGQGFAAGRLTPTEQAQQDREEGSGQRCAAGSALKTRPMGITSTRKRARPLTTLGLLEEMSQQAQHAREAGAGGELAAGWGGKSPRGGVASLGPVSPSRQGPPIQVPPAPCREAWPGQAVVGGWRQVEPAEPQQGQQGQDKRQRVRAPKLGSANLMGAAAAASAGTRMATPPAVLAALGRPAAPHTPDGDQGMLPPPVTPPAAGTAADPFPNLAKAAAASPLLSPQFVATARPAPAVPGMTSWALEAQAAVAASAVPGAAAASPPQPPACAAASPPLAAEFKPATARPAGPAVGLMASAAAAAPTAGAAGLPAPANGPGLVQMLRDLRPLVEACGVAGGDGRAFLRLFISRMDDSTRAAHHELLLGWRGQPEAIQEWVVGTVQDMQGGCH